MIFAMTTGNDSLDWVIGIFSVIFGPVAASAVWYWLLKNAANIKRTWLSINENTRVNLELREEIKILRGESATNVAILMGFLEVGEEDYIVADGNGNTISVSPALCRMIGLRTEEATNGAWKDVIHRDDIRRAKEEWKTFVNSNLTQAKIHFRFDRAEGTSPTIAVILTMVRKKVLVGGVIRIVGIFKRELQVPDTKELPKLS